MATLKQKTAKTLTWNTIDRLSSQVLYGVVGVVLANVLSRDDFGLVGVLFIFQSFATIFVDSGFGAALLQKKEPTEDDYSTVFWFNLAVSVAIYIGLWFAAPAIARAFHNQTELIPLGRTMFFYFILSALSIVQTNRLMKQMDVKQLAISNVVGQIAGGVTGIILALKGFGAWALCWQTLVLGGVRTLWLWATSHWWPRLVFSIESLRSIRKVGLGVFSSQLLNTASLQVYNFLVGLYYSVASLGVYTQADKWSKMGSASISQVLTASFIPLLARVQDDPPTLLHYIRRISRFTAFITMPALVGLALVGAPLFHLLFADKWDAAIILFRILCVRGVFVVLISLQTNFLTALGYARTLVRVEIVKDLLTIVAIFSTLFMGSVEALVWGQLAASLLTYIAVLRMTSRATGYPLLFLLKPNLPFAAATVLMAAGVIAIAHILPYLYPSFPTLEIHLASLLQLLLQITTGTLLYLLTLRLARLPEPAELRNHLRRSHHPDNPHQ